MDGRQFDSLTRALVGRFDRRTLMGRGAVLAGALSTLAVVKPASAARRGGSNGDTTICSPNGAGGYYKTSVPTILLQTYLNSGSIVSDCCGDAECGASNGCMTSYCDFNAGHCAVSYANGSPCERAGCADGYCSNGLCADPTPMYCHGDGYCNSCVYDACAHQCDCYIKPCTVDDWQCQDAYCDPGQATCILEAVNEGAHCDTFGFDGVCVMGYCTAA